MSVCLSFHVNQLGSLWTIRPLGIRPPRYLETSGTIVTAMWRQIAQEQRPQRNSCESLRYSFVNNIDNQLLATITVY